MSKISKAVRLQLAKMMQLYNEVKTEDGKVLSVEGEFAVGEEVFVSNDEGEFEPATDGTYTTTENTIITVVGGKIESISAKEPEPEPEPEPKNDLKAKEKFEAIKSAFEMTYDEKIQKIISAIVAIGFGENGYLVSASDEKAVWCVYNETGEHYTQFDITWNGEEVMASNPTEVVAAFVPKDNPEPLPDPEPNPEVETLKAENETLKSENETLKVKVAEYEKLRKQSAEPPIEHQQPKEEKGANKYIKYARDRQ